MEGFWTKIAVPIATFILCVSMPIAQAAKVFLVIMTCYVSYMAIRRHVDATTIDAIKQGALADVESMTEMFARNDANASLARVAQLATWVAMIVAIVATVL